MDGLDRKSDLADKDAVEEQDTSTLLVSPKTGAPKDIGRILRERRTVRGRSMKQVAEATGLSIGYISQIERGLSAPSLRALRAICAALDMPMRWLFGDAADKDDKVDFIVRKEERRRTDYTEDLNYMELLTSDLAKKLQMIRVVIRPGGSWGRVPDQPESDDHSRCATVIKGRLRLSLGDGEYILNTGDTFSLGPIEFIGGRCEGDEDCELIWVVSPPVY